MARFNPFEKVSGKYGAPMGRPSATQGNIVDVPRAELCAMHQGGGDGYDKGGAYWGTPSNVWAVWARGHGSDTVQYVRAPSREGAFAAALGDEESPTLPHVGDFVKAYMQAAYWTDTGPDTDIDDGAVLAREAQRHAVADCDVFRERAHSLLQEAYARGYPTGQAGHDFWLTRNGHGAGYWDRVLLREGGLGEKLSEIARAFGPSALYEGDDGDLYFE